MSGLQCGSIVHLDAAELAAVRAECGEAVQPERRVLQCAVEAERAGPDVGLAGVGHVGLGQYECAVALLYYAHVACKGGTLNGAGVVGVVNFSLAVGGGAVGALYPRGHVEGHHVGLGAFGHADLCVVGLADDDVLVVEFRVDGSAVGHLSASRHGEGRRCHGDAFQLAKEVAGMWWLVVAHAFPYHALPVLVVVPQGVVAPAGGNVGCVYAYIFIVCRARDDFLAPVAEHVARGRGGVLRPVAVGSTVGCEHDAAVGLEHAGGSLARVGTVESLL